MLSEENFQILVAGLQENMRNSNRDFANPQDLLETLQIHWDELTDFTTAKNSNDAAELKRLETEQPIQEAELKKTKDRIAELKG